MSKKIKINLLGFVTIILWTLAYPFSKIGMEHFSPNAMGFLRVTVASVTLVIIGFFTGNRIPKKRDMIWFILAGACGFGIHIVTFNKGLQTLTSASSSIVITITPVLTAVLANYIYMEKINKIGWITLITAFSGVVIMMLWDGVLSINMGIVWTLAAAVVLCFYNLLNRKLSNDGYQSIEIVTYSMIAAVFVLSPFSLTGIKELSSASAMQVMSIAVLGVLSSAVAYYLWSIAIAMADNTSDVTNYSFLLPFVATLAGALFMNEVPNMGTVIGGAIIISSIAIFSKKGKYVTKEYIEKVKDDEQFSKK